MANMGRGKQSDESLFPDVLLCAAGRFMSENMMSEKEVDSKVSTENIYSFLQSMMFRSFAINHCNDVADDWKIQILI